MKIWSKDEEATHLAERFSKLNRAKFAEEFKVPGGQSMVYQHITGRRPMSMEAAQAYARGFGCPLEEISPRLAEEAKKAIATLGLEGNEGEPGTPAQLVLTPDEIDLIAIYRGVGGEARRVLLVQIKALSHQTKEKVNHVTAKKSGTMKVPARRQTARTKRVVSKSALKKFVPGGPERRFKPFVRVGSASRSPEKKERKGGQS